MGRCRGTVVMLGFALGGARCVGYLQQPHPQFTILQILRREGVVSRREGGWGGREVGVRPSYE